jgi:LacI family transcriptional regulator
MKLKDLSELLGLSQTTVSRALNGYPEVSEETRKRVRAAADAHGYRPNMRARSLATGRAMAIGHVIPLTSQHEMVNPVFADFLAGAGEVYSKKGYDMLISIVPEHHQEQTYRELRTKGSVDGIIVHAPKVHDPRVHILSEIGLPFVIHGRVSDAAEPYCWVDMNNTHAFRRATDFLLDLGHRRIAFINGLEDMDFAIRRRAGFEEAMAARGLSIDPDFIRADEMTEQYGYEAGHELLARPVPPTAFVVSSVIPAMGLRRAIEELGFAMGRDISVICHDDELSYLKNGGDIPVFTATRSSVREAGRRAGRMLLDIIETPQTGFRQELLEAQLILGQSTGPAPDTVRKTLTP